MKYTWDLDKERKNLEKHGFDFELAERIINSSDMLCLADNRFDYGEERKLAYAEIDGVKMCLCFTIRDLTNRIISLRRVHNKEWRKVHGNGYLY